MPVESATQGEGSFRLDVPLHNLLTQSPAPPMGLSPVGGPVARHRLAGAGLYGGEPKLRPDFIDRITYCATKKNFWIYLPTNARLMRSDVIDKLADAGLPGTCAI